MKRPQIRIKLVDRLGKCGCHHGHKVGDVFDYDTQRGELWSDGSPCCVSLC